MANLEKHKKNPMQEWLEGDESTVPAQPRSSHVVGAYIKIPKPVTRKARRAVATVETPKIEAALVREPAPPPKLEEKHSQASSPEHLRKLQRLPKLRAPFAPRPQASGAEGSRAIARPATPAKRNPSGGAPARRRG